MLFFSFDNIFKKMRYIYILCIYDSSLKKPISLFDQTRLILYDILICVYI